MGQLDVWPAFCNEPLRFGLLAHLQEGWHCYPDMAACFRFFASGRTKTKIVNAWCGVFEQQLGIHHTSHHDN